MKNKQLIKALTAFLISGTLLLVSIGNRIYAETSDNNDQEKQQGWVGVATGGSHRLGIKEDGTVWAWGGNGAGQVGNGEFGKPIKSPVKVLELSDVISVSAGAANSYAIKKDGTVWVWGDNTDGQIGDGTETVRKTGSGEVIENNNRSKPVQIKGLSHVTSIMGNFAASFAVKDDGTVWGWGFISVPYQKTPVQLTALTNVAAIATGYSGNLLFLKKDGTVWSVESTLKQMKELNNIKAIAVSAGSYYALKDDGTVWAWGHNEKGQLGDGTNSNRTSPIEIDSIHNIISLQASAGGPIYLKQDGTVWTNGSNLGGQLGIGSYDDKNLPVQVKGLTHVIEISASSTSYAVSALKEDHTLWSWGGSYVGDGTEWWRTVPTMIKSYEFQQLQDVDIIKVELNGEELSFEQPPMIISERTMVPLRKIFESIGAKIEWDNDTSTVTAVKENSIIKLTIGSEKAYVNDREVQLDATPVIVNGSSLVPVRFIAESLGAKVDWDEITRSVILRTK